MRKFVEGKNVNEGEETFRFSLCTYAFIASK